MRSGGCRRRRHPLPRSGRDRPFTRSNSRPQGQAHPFHLLEISSNVVDGGRDGPLRRRQLFSHSMPSLNIMVSVPARLPQPLVDAIVEGLAQKVLSLGFGHVRWRKRKQMMHVRVPPISITRI